MANNLTIPQNFGPLSSVFTDDDLAASDEFGSGVSGSYAILGIAGKVWSVRYRGEKQNLTNRDTGDALGSVEVVLVKASPFIAKVYYINGYVEGSNTPPDCWSSNGETPDPSVQNPVCASCKACPNNVFGSRITDAGKKGKLCADSRRVAVTPLADLQNEVYGGPMLLRVPAASLNELGGYMKNLKSRGYPIFSVATRIRFDMDSNYPKLVFSPMRPLSDEEAIAVKELRESDHVARVVQDAEAFEPQEQGDAGFFEQAPAPEPAPQPVAAKPAPAPKPAPAKPAPAKPAPAARPAPARPAPRMGGISAAVANPTPAAPQPAPEPADEEAADEMTVEMNAVPDLDAELDRLLQL